MNIVHSLYRIPLHTNNISKLVDYNSPAYLLKSKNINFRIYSSFPNLKFGITRQLSIKLKFNNDLSAIGYTVIKYTSLEKESIVREIENSIKIMYKEFIPK